MLRIDVAPEPKLPAIITRANWGDLMTDVHLWQVDPPREGLNLQLLGDWLWPGIFH